MKYTFCITLLFVVFGVQLTNAQEIPIQGGKYPNPGLKKLAGTWVSIQGTDTLKIKFNFENIKLPIMDLTADVLVGYVQYQKGNQTVIDDIKYSYQTYNNSSNEGKRRTFIFGLNEYDGYISGGLPDGYTSQSFKYRFTPSTDLKTLTAVYQVNWERVYVNEKQGEGYPRKMVFKRE